MTTDFKELNEIYPGVLTLLLRDWTTLKNILWMNNNYQEVIKDQDPETHPQDPVDDFLLCDPASETETIINAPTDEITKDAACQNMIIPRNVKAQALQKARTGAVAEVFTPSFTCSIQCEITDSLHMWPDKLPPVEEIFTRAGENKTWTNLGDLEEKFKDNLWQKYILSTVCEACCGETPYLCSIYDTTSGEDLPLDKRIGMFDRKMKLVNIFCQDFKSWLRWAVEAVKHCYAYEWQGDSLLLARYNMWHSFREYLMERWQDDYDTWGKWDLNQRTVLHTKIAEIISKNMVQMDGISWCIPMSCSKTCQGCREIEAKKHDGIYVRSYDWDNDEWFYYKDLAKSKTTQDVFELF